MFQNVLYKNDYNLQLAKTFNDLAMKTNLYGEPELFNDNHLNKRLIGGNVKSAGNVKSGGLRVVNKRPYINDKPLTRNDERFLLPGTSNNYPLYNAIEMRDIDNNNISVEGGNIIKKVVKGIKKVIKNPVVKKVISSALDVGAPILGKTVGTFVGQPLLGQQVANVGRKLIKDTTGYGKKGKGVKSGGKCGASCGGNKNRAALVKKIMSEKKMSLGQASKYIKDNKLI